MKKSTVKTVSKQVENKKEVMDLVVSALENGGYTVVDCRTLDLKLSGATQFTVFARNDKADCKLSFISKADKKSPFYQQVDEALGLEGEAALCTDEE